MLALIFVPAIFDQSPICAVVSAMPQSNIGLFQKMNLPPNAGHPGG